MDFCHPSKQRRFKKMNHHSFKLRKRCILGINRNLVIAAYYTLRLKQICEDLFMFHVLFIMFITIFHGSITVSNLNYNFIKYTPVEECHFFIYKVHCYLRLLRILQCLQLFDVLHTAQLTRVWKSSEYYYIIFSAYTYKNCFELLIEVSYF